MKKKRIIETERQSKNLKNISESDLGINSEQTLQRRRHILWARRFTEIKMSLPIGVDKWQVWIPLTAQTLLPCYVNTCPFLSAITQRDWKYYHYWKNDCKINGGTAQDVAFYAGMMHLGQLSQDNCRGSNSVKWDPSQKEFLSLKVFNFQFFHKFLHNLHVLTRFSFLTYFNGFLPLIENYTAFVTSPKKFLPKWWACCWSMIIPRGGSRAGGRSSKPWLWGGGVRGRAGQVPGSGTAAPTGELCWQVRRGKTSPSVRKMQPCFEVLRWKRRKPARWECTDRSWLGHCSERGESSLVKSLWLRVWQSIQRFS